MEHHSFVCYGVNRSVILYNENQQVVEFVVNIATYQDKFNDLK